MAILWKSIYNKNEKDKIKIWKEKNSRVRLIDTAYMYSNEEEIGRAIKDSNVPREEIFIITKLYPNQFDKP